MTKVVITAEVENAQHWEKEFRTHADLFSEFGFSNVYDFAIGENSNVAVCVDVADPKGFISTLTDPKNVAAMENDGVKRDTVKVFVLDKTLKF